MRQMTFLIPDEVAERFANEVPATQQSEYLTELLQQGFRVRTYTDEEIIAACELANNDPETQEIEREMAALPNTMTEEWDDDSVKLSKAG